jgi:hypothetical protein
MGDLQGCCDALRPAAGRDRLFALARPPGGAGRPGQPRPAFAGVLQPPAPAWATRHLPAGQPRPAPAGRGARRAPDAPQRHAARRAGLRPTAPPGSTGCAPAPSGAGASRLAVRARRRGAAWDAAQHAGTGRGGAGLLRGPGPAAFLPVMYGNEPAAGATPGRARPLARFVINVLTRIRFVERDGAGLQGPRKGLDAAPPGLVPWFDVPGRASGAPMAFGHWSTLGLINRPTCWRWTPAASGAARSRRARGRRPARRAAGAM